MWIDAGFSVDLARHHIAGQHTSSVRRPARNPRRLWDSIGDEIGILAHPPLTGSLSTFVRILPRNSSNCVKQSYTLKSVN